MYDSNSEYSFSQYVKIKRRVKFTRNFNFIILNFKNIINFKFKNKNLIHKVKLQ